MVKGDDVVGRELSVDLTQEKVYALKYNKPFWRTLQQSLFV